MKIFINGISGFVGTHLTEHPLTSGKGKHQAGRGDLLVGDATKAKKKFGWKPKVTFRELTPLMTRVD